MNIIYITAYCGDSIFNKILKISKNIISPASQTYNRKIIDGFYENGVNIKLLSYLPIAAFPNTKRRIINYKYIKEKKYEKIIIPFINYQYVKQISIFISILLYLFKILIRSNERKKYVIICDYAYIPIILPCQIISIAFKIKNCIIIPDIPEIIYSYSIMDKIISNNIIRLYLKIMNKLIQRFNYYIIVATKIRERFNLDKDKCVLIEGIYSESDTITTRCINKLKLEVKNYILYTGALYKEFGIMELIQSIKYIKDESIEIWICGYGPLSEYIITEEKYNPRIKYLGIVSHSMAIKLQREAKILINPRYKNIELSKYSFPSKLMEYISAMRPIAMARLPGIPEEYFKYIYEIENIEPKSIANTLNKILMIEEDQLLKKAQAAYKFISEEKSSKVQVSKIVQLFSK